VIGISSFGVHIPRLRLQRQTAIDAFGMPISGRASKMSGARSVCASDEDALTMAVDAARDCLFGVECSKIDAVFLASSTLPFSDRKNAALLKTALGLTDELFTADLSGSLSAGCAGLKIALSSVTSGESQSALVAAADCRLAKPGSAEELLYGDAGAAILVSDENVIAEYLGGISLSRDTVFHYRMSKSDFDYKWEERWALEAGFIPLIQEAVSSLLSKLHLNIADVHRFIFPAPSASMHGKIARAVGIPSERVSDSLLDTVGDTGACLPLFMLSRALKTATPGQVIVCIGVGGGYDALCFRVTDGIEKFRDEDSLSPAIGSPGTLIDYASYLVYQRAVRLDQGIRGEVQTKTALSVLYREREMLLGLAGGRCLACGTPQFPKSRVCVNPQCRKTDTQTAYRFADKEAVIRTYTIDRLHPSEHPPSLWGLVDFDGGGRMPVEFCDCEAEEMGVGKKVRMVFRKRYEDEVRGLVGYFWKATPIRDTENRPL
jgi:3-hydroxy-3-methylglutaryl CoA synthase